MQFCAYLSTAHGFGKSFWHIPASLYDSDYQDKNTDYQDKNTEVKVIIF
jgi:hypothetical protein